MTFAKACILSLKFTVILIEFQIMILEGKSRDELCNLEKLAKIRMLLSRSYNLSL